MPPTMAGPLSRAFADAERSYLASKAAVAQRAESLFATQAAPTLGKQADLGKAEDQLRAYAGWAYACVRAIAGKCASQTVRVKQGEKEIPAHPLLTLLNDPNPLATKWSFLFAFVASLELTGRALAFVEDRRGVKTIWHIPTPWLERIGGGKSFETFYIRPPGHGGEPWPIPAEQVVYAFYPHPGDPRGAMSPLQAAAWAVTADEQIQRAQFETFRRGIFGQHALILGQNTDAEGKPTLARPTLTGAQQRQLVEAVRKRYAGFANAGEPLILDSLIHDVKRLTTAPAELDFLNSGRDLKARIMEVFGVNPIVLGAVEGANRASAAVAQQTFYSVKINPLLQLLSQTFTEFVGPMFGGGIVVEFEPAVAKDDELQLQRLTLAAQYGAVSLDELRAECGLSPLGGYAGQSLVGGGAPADPGQELLRAMQVFVGDATAKKDWATSVLFPEYANSNGDGKHLCGRER